MRKELIEVLSHKTKSTRVPIWLMRQAGRYLPEYKKIREKFPSFTDFFQNSNAAAEVTLQPLKRFDLDAAIVFSDILIVPYAMGMGIEFGKGNKSITLTGFNSEFCNVAKDVDYKAFEAVQETIKIAKREMDRDFKHMSFIGFCGAPWTVAAYMVEGGSSNDFMKAKRFAFENREQFARLIERIVSISAEYIEMQIEAGAEVIKIFDSWSGILSWVQYKDWVIKPTIDLISRIRSKHRTIPIIAFPRGSGCFYPQYSQEVDAQAIAIDQFTLLSWIRKNVKDKVLQGNLDNAILAYSKNLIQSEIAAILDSVENEPFIFNLGHGILPDTPIENVEFLIKCVREHESRKPISG